MRKSVIVAVAGAAALAVSSPVPIAAQGDTNQQLGNVHFETSCNEVAQRRFDRAMRYQHSFWYDAARDIFQEAAKADPTCGMAYWGVALTYLDNPHNPIPAPNIPLGLAAIQKAKAVGAKTERERDYIDALTFMYADADKLTHVAAHPRLPQGDGGAGGEKSERRRGADRLRHHAEHLGLTRRQDLRPAAQGRGDPGADLEAPAAASRHRALPDPPLRLPGARQRGPARRRALRRRSRRPRRTPSTCRRISSPASATGRNRSRPTSPR